MVIIHEGDCVQVKRLNTIFHVATNILSSLLLGASNLCMQLLAAPTRDEVDRAHLKGKWLYIGVPSWRNLKHISMKRKAVWWCLGISSVPLHSMLVIERSDIPNHELKASSHYRATTRQSRRHYHLTLMPVRSFARTLSWVRHGAMRRTSFPPTMAGLL